MTLAVTGDSLRLILGSGLLLTIAVVALGTYGVPRRTAAVRAAIRAAVQLAFVAVVLRGAITVGWGAGLIVAVMFIVAVGTAYRRIKELDRAFVACVVACAAGSGITVGLIVGMPVLERDTRNLIAVAGIIIGGCMTAATLTGRHFREGMIRRRDEIEGWLSIGATPRQALLTIARNSVAEALIPGHDQARTVGLVSLPGAFVGALLAGANTGAAARFQFVVLVGLICAQAVTAVTTAALLGAPRYLPPDQ